jgi:hypothetical protein
MDYAIEHGESNLQVLFGNKLWNFMPSKNKRNGDLVYNGHYWFTNFLQPCAGCCIWWNRIHNFLETNIIEACEKSLKLKMFFMFI